MQEGAAIRARVAAVVQPRTSASSSSSATAVAQRRVDAGVQQRRRPHGVQASDHIVDERRPGVVGRDQHDPRLGAELAGATRDGRSEPLGDRVGARAQSGGGDQRGIDRPHLGEHRDRPGARRGHVEQRAAPRERARERDRLDLLGSRQHLADVARSAVHEREGAGRESDVLDRGKHDRRHLPRGSGMRRMCLDDDGASGGERGGRVAAGDAERVREVAGAEHGDRPDRDQHPA